MTDFVLPRSGNSPLRFCGELIAEADGSRQSGREQTRWHELAVYRTEGGRYVARRSYRTRWQGELDRDECEALTDTAAVARWFRDCDPTACVAGYPAGRDYAEKQTRLMSDIRARYDSLVSEVLSSDEFVEEVE